jgi:hypothetical protein
MLQLSACFEQFLFPHFFEEFLHFRESVRVRLVSLMNTNFRLEVEPSLRIERTDYHRCNIS